MLDFLKVRNYVLIDSLDLEFNEGFSVLTGETGSGKTIIMGALSLLLGQKADKESVRNGAESAEVSGLFITDSEDVLSYLESLDIPAEDGELLIKRVIRANGRSSYSVNGSTITRTQGETLGKLLVDVSSQHAHQSLMDDSVLLSTLDEYSNTLKEKLSYKEAYAEYKSLEKSLLEAEERVSKTAEEAEYFRFCLNELESADLKIGEEESLKEDIQRISSSEFLRENISEASQEIRCASSSISSSSNQVGKAVKKDPSLLEFSERLESIVVELDDIFTSFRDYLEGISYSEYELEAKNSRLSQIQRIKRRFGGSVEEAIKRRDEYRESLDNLEDSEAYISSLKKKADKAKRNAEDLAEILSQKRRKGALELSRKIEENLHELGMQSATFRIEVVDEELSMTGKDKVSFKIAANKGEKITDIQATSSGGELSRIMLAIKASINSSSDVNTLIFDEIDSGLGGVVANSVSDKLKSLSENHQVLAITHLSQLASKADHHYLVRKEEVNGRTISHIDRIEGEERVKEIARLLSGETSDISLEHARSLLEV